MIKIEDKKKTFQKNIKTMLKKQRELYINSPLRIVEIIVCIVAYVGLSLFINSSPMNDFNRIWGQIQFFLALFISFRFGFFGFLVVFIPTMLETSYILKLIYSDNNSVSILAGLTSKILVCFSSVLVLILSNIIKKQKIRLELLAITDELTDVYNLRWFKENLAREIETVRSNNSAVGLILIDIDNFKMYNDVYGHQRGDKVLKVTASLIKVAAGNKNMVYRYGGDEFAVLLPDADMLQTKHVADQIRMEFEEKKEFCFGEGIGSMISLSMGISEYPNMAGSFDEIVNQADMALYHSKNLGKNKVHFYKDVISRIRKNISSDHQHMISVFRTLLSTISAKDRYTHSHCERVSSYAVMIGEALGMSLKEISTLQYAGLLHDIGKIEIPKSILNKSGRLTDDEYELIKMHPVYSANILEPLSDMEQLIDYVMHHHERYDGCGYPSGLAGREISLGARILCVADSYDAMLSERPYSGDMRSIDALGELRTNSGTQFDPEIVDLFIDILTRDGYELQRA